MSDLSLFDSPFIEIKSPKDLEVSIISAFEACKLNAKWHSRFPYIHYTNITRTGKYRCYVATYESVPYAVAIWSRPIAANRLKNGGLMLELRRLAISKHCPKNTASWMLKKMRKDIVETFPEIIKLISYQDTESHLGTIYKADNWKMASISKPTSWSKTGRIRNTEQSMAPKVRWEYTLKEVDNYEQPKFIGKIMDK